MDAPKTYHIERIADILQIPCDRREQCLRELLYALQLADFADAKLLGPMTWTDDGDMSCSLTDDKGEAQLTLEITRNDR